MTTDIACLSLLCSSTTSTQNKYRYVNHPYFSSGATNRHGMHFFAARWCFGLLVDQRRDRLVLGWMGDCRHAAKPRRYATSHPGQLSPAIPPRTGAMSKSCDVNRHTARCTNPVSVVTPQCKLVSGWGLRKRRSAPPLCMGLMAPKKIPILLYAVRWRNKGLFEWATDR